MLRNMSIVSFRTIRMLISQWNHAYATVSSCRETNLDRRFLFLDAIAAAKREC